MELVELQNIWEQYDKKLADNTRLNKEILRRMLLSKPEKRLNWIKIKAGFNLILPIALILLVLVPHIQFRSTIDFYIGLSFFSAFSIITYSWSIRYYLLICKIDFSGPILLIKKQVAELEKFKIKITRLGYIFSPFAMVAIFLMAQMPIFSTDSILPFSLIALVMIASIYYTFKYSIYDQFRKLDKEMTEIIELEKRIIGSSKIVHIAG